MSRARKQPRWCCLKCGEAMYRELADTCEQKSAKLLARSRLVHVCGECQHWHKEGDDGRLRELTAAERFEVEMAVQSRKQILSPIDANGVPGGLLQMFVLD